jgi:MOSC domain-containing protein YiiM
MGEVIAVAAAGGHDFSKPVRPSIRLLAGLGVEGDAHCGVTVKHRSRVAQNPDQPNLRQVHLVAAELLDQLRAQGFDLAPGSIGENVTVANLDLLGLPRGTLLHLGDAAVVEVTGLRNPCRQLDRFQPGLMRAVLGREPDGTLILKAGIMGTVRQGGVVRPGDAVRAEMPPPPHLRLQRV